MKAVFSEQYYEQIWEKMIVKVPGEDYINLEAELEAELNRHKATITAAGLSEDVWEKVLPMYRAETVRKLVEKCTVLCKKEMARLKEIEAGKASFGMVTQAQEISARAELRKRFEFNCYQLSVFKKKHFFNV